MGTPLRRGGIRASLRLACAILLVLVLWDGIGVSRNGVASAGCANSLQSRFRSGGRRRQLLRVSVNADERELESHASKRSVVGEVGAGLNGSDSILSPAIAPDAAEGSCRRVNAHPGYPDSCSFVRAHETCRSGTLIDYTSFFYCFCSGVPLVGLAAFLLWLAALFYVLGNTAADYFCCSLEKLCKLLHLPPTVAGVSLLPLGNGAPDVFASIAAFVGAGTGDVGLNSVLGGATFVTTVVMGSVSMVIAGAKSPTMLRIDRFSFLRDVGFFLATLVALLAIIVLGQVSLFGALCYVSIYVVYGATVAVLEVRKKMRKGGSWQAMQPLIPADCFDMPLLPPSSVPSDQEVLPTYDGGDGLSVDPDLAQGFSSVIRGGTAVETSLPQWKWAPHVAIYSHQGSTRRGQRGTRPLWGWSEEEESGGLSWCTPRGMCVYLIEWPLSLPRRMTIPIVEDDRWSKKFAVTSATLSPLLLAMVWEGKDGLSGWQALVGAGGVGAALGLTAFFTLTEDHPPRRFLFPWVLGGFVTSILWFYIIANELVAALIALGVILSIDAAILGLTVLAWGNSIGDLVSNLALVHHGVDGVQIAVSGCYAGPMFNTLVGLGLSLVLASWKSYPAPYSLPNDHSIFYTLAFLVAGLLWALWILPKSAMQPSKQLGIGLLVLYVTFLTLRLTAALGFISVAGLL